MKSRLIDDDDDTLFSPCLAERQEDVLEARLVVPPALGLEHHHPARAVGRDEAVDGVVDLAAVAAALVEAAHQLAGLVAVGRVLQGVEQGLDEVAQFAGLLKEGQNDRNSRSQQIKRTERV